MKGSEIIKNDILDKVKVYHLAKIDEENIKKGIN